MKRNILLFAGFCTAFFIRCEKKDFFTTNQFIVTYLASANPCTGWQIRFEEHDLGKLRAVLNDPEIHDGWFGTVNLGDSFKAGQKIRVAVRALELQEYQICPALYLMLRQVYVIEAVPHG